MRVCLICEGSYPYVAGGVSSWVQMLCSAFSDVEFVIWSIATTREEMSELKYKLLDNIKEVRTIYLGDDEFSATHKRVRLTEEEVEALRQMVIPSKEPIDWKKVLYFIKKKRNRLVDILMDRDFYHICLEQYEKSNSTETFKDYLWSFRSMYFPLMDILSGEILQADLYHSLSTGYAGILGSAAAYVENKPFLLSEHGIYTREREEDIIRANWVQGEFKELWIDFFKKLSMIAYRQANVVTTLFGVNRTLQMELGCPQEKIETIPNGVSVQEFADMKSKGLLARDKFNIAAILRIVPIKDVKTMLLAYQLVRIKEPNVRLTLLGNFDEDPYYYRECLALIQELNIRDVYFLGQVNIRDYLPDIDLLLLSSISEGQPFAILEGMAAGVPVISTNVGDCRELLEGTKEDELGPAGYIVPIMDNEAMADAMVYAIRHPKELEEMGRVGKERVKRYYQKEAFLEKYRDLYQRLGGE